MQVFEVEPLLCPECGGEMKVISFITDYAVVDRIINHLKLTFIAERSPPHPAQQLIYMTAEQGTEYLS